MIFFIALILAMALLVWIAIRGALIIPHQEAWVVQRLGRYHRTLDSGPHWIVPLVDEIAYRHSLKEEAINVTEQTAITQDNVSVHFDGVVYLKVVDPFAASYGVKEPIHAITQLVQTSMRSEVGKIPLDKTFEERESLNARIVDAINEAARSWGITCLRYEIKDINMPEDIRKAMELQMTAERQKRARILESEGQRQAQINLGEAAEIDRINRARGEAGAIGLLAKATALGIEEIAQSLNKPGGDGAASLQVAEKYLEAFRGLAKESNVMLLPSDLHHPGAMIAGALGVYEKIKQARGRRAEEHPVAP